MDWLKNNKWKIVTGVVALVFVLAWFSTRADAAEPDLAPVSVTQERVLEAGEVEFFYTYNNQRANGVNDGSHSFGGLWSPVNAITLGASTVNNDGFGDTFVFGTVEAGELLGFEVRPSLGVSIPNGFSNNGPLFDEASGTTDLVPAVSFVRNGFGDAGDGVELGAQWKGEFRLGKNDFNFDIGDSHTLTAWGAIRPHELASLYVFGQGQFISSADGFMLAGNSEAVRVGAGVNVYVEGFRVSGEVAVPVHESYTGLRNGLDEARVFRVGAQRTF